MVSHFMNTSLLSGLLSFAEGQMYLEFERLGGWTEQNEC